MKSVLALLTFFIVASPAAAQPNATPWSADIVDIRKVAAMIPGAKPTRVNVVKFAESRRSKKFSIKGAADEPSIQARTAFQLVYPDGTVMIDSGMDLQVHKFFGRGVEEPYFQDKADQVAKAVRAAKAIVMTHEHGDHVAGVIRTPFFAELAAKSVLTKTQVQTLMTEPQMPEVKLSADQAKRFIVVDYETYYPFAPGMALIKAPGHTPGSQMIYVALQSGREYLFAGDAAWHMDGVRTTTGKDAPWITEETDKVNAELKWLNQLSQTEKNLVIVVSHDEDQRNGYIRQGLLGDGFQ